MTESEPNIISTETPCQQFYRFHAVAFQSTAQGQQLDSEGHREQAFNEYQKAIKFIDSSVQLAHREGFPPNEVNNIDEKVYKMRKIRKEILERITNLQQNSQELNYLAGPTPTSTPTSSSNPTNNDPPRNPPSYNEAMSIATKSPLTLSENVNTYTMETFVSSNLPPVNAQEVFRISKNMQIYFINSDVNVSSPSYPPFLSIVVLQPDATNSQFHVPAFLQVGEWTYPLIPKRSPILKSKEGVYVFPDLSSSVPGSSVGLVLPSDLSANEAQKFENVLFQLLEITHFLEETRTESSFHDGDSRKLPRDCKVPQEYTPASAKRISTKITSGLITGAEAITKGLAYGANKTSHYLEKGTAYLQSKRDTIQQKAVVNTTGTTNNANKAKPVIGKTVQVSGYHVSQLRNDAKYLGQQLASEDHKQDTTAYLNMNSETTKGPSYEKLHPASGIASGTPIGGGIVYHGLEEAAKILSITISNNNIQNSQTKR